MARTRKSIQPLNLYKYDVLIEDRGNRSDYFKISQFDGYFYGGRNAFLVAGASILRPNTKILVEILNANGTTVYSAPVTTFVEGNSRLVQVEVYSDTPIGPGKIILLGCTETYLDGTPVPEEWRDKYNVRWITDVIISPLIENKTPIRFEATPQIAIEEKFYAIPSASSFTEKIEVPVDLTISPKYLNVFPNGYTLKLTGPTNTLFVNNYLGGIITGSIAIKETEETASINLPITKIYSNTLAETEGSLIYTDKKNLLLNATLSSSGIYTASLEPMGTSVVSGSISLLYNILNTVDTGSSVSFAKLRIVNLKTVSGEINKVRLSYKSETDPGEYVLVGDVETSVQELLAVDKVDTIQETGKFSNIEIDKYWYNATMSIDKTEVLPTLPTYYISSSLIPTTSISIVQSSDDLLDGINATPEIVDGTFINSSSYFIGTRNTNSITLFPTSEYTLAFDAFINRTSASVALNQEDYTLQVYLVEEETGDSDLLETNVFGQLLGELIPSKTFTRQNFERVEFNFIPNIIRSGKFGLRFVVYGGHWSIANVSLKVAQEDFFSPDEIDILIPIVSYEDTILTFKAEYVDVNNNSAAVSTFSTPLYITGSRKYVRRIGDTMSGELYIKDLPIYNNTLQDLHTGLVSGGLITTNSLYAQAYDVSAGAGYIVNNYTDPLNPTYTYVTWSQFSHTSSAFPSSGSLPNYPRTNIAIDSNGQVYEKFEPFTRQDYRNYIVLGRIAHVGVRNIQRTLSLPFTAYGRGYHSFDFIYTQEPFNVSGNEYYPSGSPADAQMLKIAKTAGETYRLGSNYRTNVTDPDITVDQASTQVTFAYRWRSGSGFAESAVTTSIDPNHYDNGSGTIQLVGNNNWSVQRIYYFGATNTTRIQYGQTVYPNFAAAEAGAFADAFTVDPNLSQDATWRAALIVRATNNIATYNLNNVGDAKIVTVTAGAGGGGGGGGGGATALSALSDVTLTDPVIGDGLAYDGVAWINIPTASWTVASSSITEAVNVMSGSIGLEFTRYTGSFSGSLYGTAKAIEIEPDGTFDQSQIRYTGSFTGSMTGSLLGTSSWTVSSSQAITASYVLPSGLPPGTISSSLQFNTFNTPFTGSFTGSFIGPLTGTASYASNANLLDNLDSTAFYLATNPNGYTTNTGTVTSIATNNGVTGGTITTTGTIGLTGQALALHNLSSSGFIVRTAADTVSARSISVTGVGLSITNADGVSGNPVITIGGSVVSSSGQVDHNATTNYVANRHIDHTAVSISTGTGLTGGGDISSTRTLALTGQALALHNLASNGIIVRTAADTVSARSISVTGVGLSITNADGVAGNPIITIGGGLISASTFSSPSQGTVRATINGTQTDVDTGLQTADSPSFAGLTVDTNTLFVDATNDRVGVGTITPLSKLQVAGNISGSSYTSSINNAVGFFGTSSWAVTASNAISSSYAITASYSISASNTITSSYAITSSNAITASSVITSHLWAYSNII